MADQLDPDTNKGRSNADFQALIKQLIISEIRIMIGRLKEKGDFSIPSEFEELDLRALNYLRRQLRDTLRTMGGGR